MAYSVTEDWMSAPTKKYAETKLGAFKLAGLSPLRITARRFGISGLFNPNDERYRDVTLVAVAPE